MLFLFVCCACWSLPGTHMSGIDFSLTVCDRISPMQWHPGAGAASSEQNRRACTSCPSAFTAVTHAGTGTFPSALEQRIEKVQTHYSGYSFSPSRSNRNTFINCRLHVASARGSVNFSASPVVTLFNRSRTMAGKLNQQQTCNREDNDR